MSSKKLSKQKRKDRRLLEVAKAQMTSVPSFKAVGDIIKEEKLNDFISKSSYHELPLKEIKKGVLKNFIFLGFAVLVIIGLKLSGIDFSKFLSLRL